MVTNLMDNVVGSFRFCRFTKQFIDARENERKRSQRGIVSVPPKHKKFDLNQSSGNAQNVSASSAKDSDSSTGFKAEHLLELQEKITKEILSTKLEEKEMHRLQVMYRTFVLHCVKQFFEQLPFVHTYTFSYIYLF